MVIRSAWARTLTSFTLSVLPAVVWASEEGGEHHVPDHVPFNIYFHAVNLLIFLALLTYFLRRPLRDMLVKRHDAVRDALAKAEAAQRAAEEKAASFERRVKELEGEMERLRVESEADSRTEAARILENSQKQAEKLKQDAVRMMEAELATVRETVRREAIELAVEMAERMTRQNLTPADQNRLLTEYLKSLRHNEVN